MHSGSKPATTLEGLMSILPPLQMPTSAMIFSRYATFVALSLIVLESSSSPLPACRSPPQVQERIGATTAADALRRGG